MDVLQAKKDSEDAHYKERLAKSKEKADAEYAMIDKEIHMERHELE